MSLEEDFKHPLRLNFYISNFDKLMRLVSDGIENICPQTDYLMRFWQIKHALNPSWSEDMFNEQRDSYEREDNYNVYGVFVFFAMKIRQPFLAIEGVNNDVVQLTSVDKYTFSVPMSPNYTHELMLPLLDINLRSQSQTLQSIAQEVSQMVAFFT